MKTQEIDIRNLSREERGKLIFQRGRIARKNDYWVVGSQTSFKVYKVKFNGHEPTCTCPDCQLRKGKCKHIYAVEFYIKHEINEEGKLTTTKGVKVTYKQDWKAYDYSQTNEKFFFMKLLKDLSENVEQPTYKFGRPTLPISDMLFASALKVYSTFSLRRFMSDVKIAQSMKMIDNVPNFMTISNFMNDESITPILKQLIKLSATPLSSVEQDFTIDSSGFSTCRFARWFDYKWGKEKKYRIWLKAHLCSGVKTNIITSAEITEGDVNDNPLLPQLVKETSDNFEIKEVSADKGYTSKTNLEAVEELGGIAFIPFKNNVTGKARGSSIWKKMYHYFIYKHDEFLEHYHKRSNAETIFHMIKSKFKDNLRSKGKTAQVNELLLKILCHNICCVIQEISELGIKGEFIVEEKIQYEN
jgi:transposase